MNKYRNTPTQRRQFQARVVYELMKRGVPWARAWSSPRGPVGGHMVSVIAADINARRWVITVYRQVYELRYYATPRTGRLAHNRACPEWSAVGGSDSQKIGG